MGLIKKRLQNVTRFLHFANIRWGDFLSIVIVLICYAIQNTIGFHQRYRHWPPINLVIVNNFDFWILSIVPLIVYLFFAWIYYSTQKKFKSYSYKTLTITFLLSELSLFPGSVLIFNLKSIIGFAPYSLTKYIKHNYTLFGLLIYPVIYVIWLFVASAKKGADDFEKE